jgi:hypothetical protein
VKPEFYDGVSWYSVATETFVNSKVFDINSNTSGSLNINRLQGYPSSINAFLRGDGTWILPYINNLNINSDVSFANYKIVNLANPVNAQDGVTKNYVDTKDINSFPITSAGLGIGGYNIYNLGNPTQPQHAATKSYVDSLIPSGSVILSGAISGSGALGSSIITTLSDTINKSSDQTFNFSSSTSNFNHYFPNSGGNGTKIRMGRSGVTTGLYGFEFQSTTLGNGTAIFNFNFSGTNSIYNIFTLTENTPQIIFNSYRLSGILEPQISTDVATKNYADTSTIAPSRISGYPSNSNLFLNGLGSWSTATVSLPLNLYTSSINNGGITIYNSNNSATTTGFNVLNQNTNNGVQFGYNSSTLEGYVWTGSGLSLKFGTNNITRILINSNGSIDCQSNDILTTGTINATTGTLKANNLSTYNAGTIVVASPFSMSNNYITGLANPVNNQDAATKYYVDNNNSGNLSSNSINVNTIGGTTNWIRRNINTTTSIQVYGLTSTSYILENNNGESAGIGFDGSTDTCTIWTAGDSGWYLNIQDEDSTNSRVAYVASNTGVWTTVSSRTRKHSIKEKVNNNILDRFLNLSVKSYGYKYDINNFKSEKQKLRIHKKQNKMAIGLILEELFDIFPNCIPDYYNELHQNKDATKKINLENEIKDISNCGIDYNTLLCYFIMAFQEFVQKTNNNILELRGKK